MGLKKLIIVFGMLISAQLFPQSKSDRAVITPYASPSLKFTENLGQWDKKVLFRAQMDGGAMFIEPNCLTFNFYDKKKLRAMHQGGLEKGTLKDPNIQCHAYKMHFKGSNPNYTVVKEQMGLDYENFYYGNDKSKWKGNVHNYHQVWLKEIYKNIDYEIITAVNGFKYNFHVKPNANVDNIKLEYEGVDKLKIKNGAIHVGLSVNSVTEQKPYAYQIINNEIIEVVCNYKLEGSLVGFEFPKGYDNSVALIIDPVLVFSGQSGSTADNFGMTATFDKQGNLYSGGTVYSIGYPFIMGSYSNVFNGSPAYGNTDLFITKYSANGNSLIYSTYMGGNGSEVVSSLIVDKNNNLYLYGATGSSNFPITAGAAYPTFSGGQSIGFISNGTVFFNGTDIYIAKFNPTGSALLGCTYYGGSGNDGVNYLESTNVITFALAPAAGTATTNTTNYDSLQYNYGDTYRGEIQLDTLENVYITSSTRSFDLPMVGGFDNTLGGKQDALVAKFNTNLTALVYSSFIGGSKNDCGNSLYVLPNFEVYVTGGTCSNNFPNTVGGHSPTFNGGKCDGYITKVNAAGNAVIQASYIGTASYDNSFFVSCNSAGDPHVYGQSQGNIPVMMSASATTIYSVANTHQFIIKYNSGLTAKLFSTVFGSSTFNMDISPSAFAVDECNGNIYLSGWGGNILTGPAISGMPILNATQPTTTGYDFYLMALGPNATSLLYGSYYGGGTSQEHVDGGTSRFDRKGVIYQSVCAGCGGNQDFPITPNTWPCPNSANCPNPNLSTNCNNGVFKIDFQLQAAVATLNTNTVSGCSPLTVNLTNATPGTSFMWHFGNGNTNSVTLNPTVTYTTPGTYTISLVVNDILKCIKKDSTIKVITVLPGPNSQFNATVANCLNTFTAANTTSGVGNTYVWNFGDASPTSTLTSPTHTYATTGTYTVKLVSTNSFGCKDSVLKPVNILIFSPGVASAPSICVGGSTSLFASGGTSYTWSPGAMVSNTSIASPVVTPTSNTIYSVTIYNNTFGNNCITTLTTEVAVNPKPTANFNYSINPCGGGVYYTDLSAADISGWNWSLSPTATSTVQHPYYFYANGGNFLVTLISTNIYGCTDTTSQNISVPSPPPLSVNNGSYVCLGKSAQLSASGGVSYSWTPASTLNQTDIASPVANPTVSTGYSVVITTSDNCTFLLTTFVNVSTLSNSQIGASANPTGVVKGNASILNYVGDPGATVYWYPSASVNPKTGYTVSATPDRPTTYTVIAANGACRETLYVFVDVFIPGCIEGDAYVPNTFTPNGDGQNDILYVRGLKVEELYFAIYNRWGELVFETKDKSKGWDGIYKGKAADVGVFGWYLRVKCYNGEESFKKGNVTLIR